MVTFLIGVLVGAVIGFCAAAIMAASRTETTEEDIEKWQREQREKQTKRRAKHGRDERMGENPPADVG